MSTCAGIFDAMAELIYTTIMSLDGYIADEHGNFDWAAPDEEVHRFVNDLERPVGTYLYGRRMYEVMSPWETMDSAPDQPQVILDFARIWQAADKVVHSRTLDTVSTARTRIERQFDPEAVRQLKASTGPDLAVGGPHLAAQAIQAGLVDEYHLFLTPTVVGGGNQALPDHVRLDLDLQDERRFTSGVVFLRYRQR
jgi:dihydrofolate reductase